MTKPIPKVYATRFFQLITTRQFAEADRILERVKQKMHVSERNRGYFQALYGMLLTQRSGNDRYSFLSSLDLSNNKQLKRYRHEFQGHVESRLHGEYDRGFFEAWVDYMKVLPKLDASTVPSNNRPIAEAEKTAEKQVETQTAPAPAAEPTSETEAQPETGTEAATEEKPEPEKESPVVTTASPQKTLVDYAN